MREEGNKRLKSASARFYTVRRRIYGGLLLFIVAAGLPMASVPQWRNRLLTRVHALKVAFTGETIPAMVQAGGYQDPFPVEYERPASPLAAEVLNAPPPPIVYSKPLKRETPIRVTPRRALKIPPVDSESQEPEETASVAPGQPAQDVDSYNQPKYGQGTIEKEAYDLLINSNAAAAGLVQGSNPSLKFLSWDAAGRGDDLYWVRLRFRSEGKPDVEYIWQVHLESKKITPLNYNARTL